MTKTIEHGVPVQSILMMSHGSVGDHCQNDLIGCNISAALVSVKYT